MEEKLLIIADTIQIEETICSSFKFCLVSWSVVAERSSALDSSSGVARMWVRIPAWPVAALVSLSKTLNHNCFVLRMGCKAVHVGPVCCVMHVKEPRTLIVKEKGLAPVFLDSRLEHPSGWICARYKSYYYYYYSPTTNPLNIFLQRCNTRIGRFLRRFESNLKLRVISIDMVI